MWGVMHRFVGSPPLQTGWTWKAFFYPAEIVASPELHKWNPSPLVLLRLYILGLLRPLATKTELHITGGSEPWGTQVKVSWPSHPSMRDVNSRQVQLVWSFCKSAQMNSPGWQYLSWRTVIHNICYRKFQVIWKLTHSYCFPMVHYFRGKINHCKSVITDNFTLNTVNDLGILWVFFKDIQLGLINK